MARPKAIIRRLRMTYPFHFHPFALLLHQYRRSTDLFSLSQELSDQQSVVFQGIEP